MMALIVGQLFLMFFSTASHCLKRPQPGEISLPLKIMIIPCGPCGIFPLNLYERYGIIIGKKEVFAFSFI
jgi:hypothetical protein